MRKMRNSAGIASNFDEQRNLRASKNSLELKTLGMIEQYEQMKFTSAITTFA